MPNQDQEAMLTAKLQAIVDKVYEQAGDMRTAARILGGIPHTRIGRPGRFNTPTLIQISRSGHPEAAPVALELLAVVLPRRKGLPPLPGDWRDDPDNVIRLDKARPRNRTERELPALVHAGLQLQVTDFAQGALIDAAVQGDVRDKLDRALIGDLIFTLINARFFSSYASALRQKRPVPIHPFGWLELGPFVTEAAAEKDASREQANSLSEGIDHYLFAMGRETKFVFMDNRQFPANGEGGGDLQKSAEAALDDIIELAAHDDAMVCPRLSTLLEFDSSDAEIPDPLVVMACAAMAAFRCELAVVNAARTLLLSLPDQPPPRRSPLLRIASRIFDQCQATYLLAAERTGEAVRALPETDPRQHQSDHERIMYGYHLTGTALSRAEGVWFFLHHNQSRRLGTGMSIAFVGSKGSALFPATFDERGTGPLYHSFSFDDDDPAPTSPPENFDSILTI